MRRFYFACGLIAVLCGMAALVDAQDTTYVGKYYDVVKLDRRTQADSLTVLEHFVPPSVSTLPTCNTDTEPAIVFDESDNLFKGCSDLSGSFEWTPLGRDNDQDGVRNDFDGTPNTAFTFTADDPFALRVTTTYSGTDAQLDFSGTDRYLEAPSPLDNRSQCAALILCREKGDLSVSSLTTGTANPRATLNHAAATCGSVLRLGNYLAGGPLLSGTAGNGNAVTGVTCIGTRGT